MKTASPFVAVENLREEIEYYRGILGGEAKILRKRDDLVLNADLLLGETKISFADVITAKPAVKGDYVKVMLRNETEEEFYQVYKELTAGGRVLTEAYEAPFNGLLAIVSDRNGIAWVLSYYR